MRDITEVVIAVSFTLPKVHTVLSRFLGLLSKEILLETQYDDFAILELQGHTGQIHFILRHIRQHPLVVHR